MNGRFYARLLTLLIVFSVLVSACGAGKTPAERAGGSTPSTAGTPSTSSVATQQPAPAEETGGTSPASALTNPPETLPKSPKAVDPSSYAYDDMSKKYDIEIMLVGPFNQPRPDDPIKRYLDKKFNANIKLTSLTADDMRNSIATRFASGDPPDFIVMPFKDVALSLFEQGQTAEVSQILPLMPQAAQYVTKDYKKWATVDDQMIGIPRYATFPDNWGLFIRSDFLKALGMKEPTNENELFDYAQAVTTKDPDKDGKADSWFMATGGGGTGWGMMGTLATMYGHPSWNVVDGKINHPMLDGTTKKHLQFLKKLNDNKLLPPDWYTTPWEQLKSRTFNDQLGMVFYPGWNLVDETYNAKKRDKSVLREWKPIPPLKSADGKGGKYAPGGSPGGLFIFSKQAAEDEGKLKRITHLVDTMIYPNENYWAVSQGGGPEIFPKGSKVTLNPDGTNVFYIDKEKHPAYTDSKYQSLPDWQSVGYTLLYQVYTDPVGKVGSEYNKAVVDMPRYENYDLFLTLDGPTVSKVTDFQTQNEIQFVLGKRSFDDWDSYVEQWKRTGGQKLIDQAAEQLGVSK
jgi:ABC-type glycerol-3-phosphate transport system substrate-binding protein